MPEEEKKRVQYPYKFQSKPFSYEVVKNVD
jgi:hypothetical protein